MSNNKIIFLGDVHGDIKFCKELCLANPDATIVQIGDLGVGTSTSQGGVYDENSLIGGSFIPPKFIAKLPPNFKFFCGNHDCRDEANKLDNCLGDFGEYAGFFFFSGADSYDKDSRTAGVTWWENEELTYAQCNAAIEAWTRSEATVLVGHDAPQSVVEGFLLNYFKSKTRTVLQMMIDARKPKVVIFGHHHKSVRAEKNGTKFIGLGMAEEYKMNF